MADMQLELPILLGCAWQNENSSHVVLFANHLQIGNRIGNRIPQNSMKHRIPLLMIDSAWGYISHQIHYRGQRSNALRWAGINIAAMFLGIFVAAYRFDKKPEVIMVLAIGRTIVDYWCCWDFYFPYRQDFGKATEVKAGA
jgi:hypothetical protein